MMQESAGCDDRRCSAPASAGARDVLATWPAPEGLPESVRFQVRVRRANDPDWTGVFVHSVPVGQNFDYSISPTHKHQQQERCSAVALPAADAGSHSPDSPFFSYDRGEKK